MSIPHGSTYPIFTNTIHPTATVAGLLCLIIALALSNSLSRNSYALLREISMVVVVAFSWDPLSTVIATSTGFTESVAIAMVVVEAIEGGFGGGDGGADAVNFYSPMIVAPTVTATFA